MHAYLAAPNEEQSHGRYGRIDSPICRKLCLDQMRMGGPVSSSATCNGVAKNMLEYI